MLKVTNIWVYSWTQRSTLMYIHISHVKSRMSRFIGISKQISHYFNLTAAKNYYFSHVYASVTYGIAVWGGWLKLSKYDVVSNKHIRITCNIFWRHAIPYQCKFCILKKHKLLKLCDVYKLNILCLMYLSRCSTSNRISKYVNKKPRHLHHDIRNINEYVLPHFRVNQVQYGFEYQSLLSWNSLPSQIKQAKSIKAFKKTIYRYGY